LLVGETGGVAEFVEHVVLQAILVGSGASPGERPQAAIVESSAKRTLESNVGLILLIPS